jgi:hypothetical protein
VESEARDLTSVIQEMLLATTSEREGRVIDFDGAGSMEKKKQEGVLLMAMTKDDLIATDIDAYLEIRERKTMLRFITCGSVDDGKSTLIGRLLYESHLVFDDHLAVSRRILAK